MTSFEKSLDDLAVHLAEQARDPKTDIQDKVRVFKELREYRALLTKPAEKGDKETSRRPTTMAGMRENIARLSVVSDRGEPDDEPAE